MEEGLLQAVCDIRFVATNPVKQELRALHPQFGEGRDGNTPYIAFKNSVIADHTEIVWTTGRNPSRLGISRELSVPDESSRFEE